MGFRRSRGSAKERDAPQTIYCTAVCLTSTRASECVAGDLDLRSLKRPYIALPAESTPEEVAAICGRNKVDRVILEITEEDGPATLGKRLKAAMLLRRQNREMCVELLLDNKRWPGLYAEAKDCVDRGVVSKLYLTDLTTTLVETVGVERHGRWLSWLLFFAKRAEKSDDTTDAKRRRAAMEKK